MIVITLLVGIVLIVLGVGFYVMTNYVSATALIPAFLGVAIVLCGAFAFKPKLRHHMMHLALVLSLLAIIAFGHRAWITAFSEEGKATTLTELLLSIAVCAGYIALGVRSFLAARRQRKQEQAGG